MGEDLTEGGAIQTILKTSAPLVVAFFLQSAFNLVDAFFVGQLSPKALAAVSVSFPILFLIISLGAGIGVGVTSVVARFIGAGEQKKADEAAEHAVVSALVIGIVLAVAGLLITPFLFDLMGATGSLKELALQYINVLLAFAPIMLAGFVGNSILQGEGDMNTPMKVMGFSAILNMILDPFFIFYLDYGVQGAAIATVFSRLCALICVYLYIFQQRSWITLRFRKFRYQHDYIKRIFAVGIPSSLSNVSMSIGMFILTAIVGLFGTNALAAFGVGFRLDSLAILPGLGISIAVVSMVGQNVGAGKIERARNLTFKSGLLSSALMTFIGIFFYIFAPSIMAIFNSNQEVIDIGVSLLRILPFSYLVIGLTLCISSAFMGSGRAIIALAINALRLIVFAAPIAYILAMEIGVDGVWWGIVIAGYLSVAVSLFFFKTQSLEKTTLEIQTPRIAE